jgi:hypothetical protein
MEYYGFVSKIVKAQKNHICEWCGEDIPKGTDAWYRKYKWDGRFISAHQHKKCFSAMNRSDVYLITLDEWTARLRCFFESNDEWVKGCKHNLSVFIKHFHRFIPMKKPKRVSDAKIIIQCNECGKAHPATYQCWVREEN